MHKLDTYNSMTYRQRVANMERTRYQLCQKRAYWSRGRWDRGWTFMRFPSHLAVTRAWWALDDVVGHEENLECYAYADAAGVIFA